MNKSEQDKIAELAANMWCRCFKCDGTDSETHNKCDKKNRLTCAQWYNAYRGAKLALELAEKKQKSVDFVIEKACEWLNNNTISTTPFVYTYTASSDNIDKKTFIEQFKKAMEE